MAVWKLAGENHTFETWCLEKDLSPLKGPHDDKLQLLRENFVSRENLSRGFFLKDLKYNAYFAVPGVVYKGSKGKSSDTDTLCMKLSSLGGYGNQLEALKDQQVRNDLDNPSLSQTTNPTPTQCNHQ